MTLKELQRIKRWHVAHRGDHPLEYHLFETVLTLWMMGWIGTLPAFLFSEWAIPFCVVGMVLPQMYIGLRTRAHQSHRMRCDWISGG